MSALYQHLAAVVATSHAGWSVVTRTVAPSGPWATFWTVFIDIGPILFAAAAVAVLWLLWVLFRRRFRRLVMEAVRDALELERGRSGSRGGDK